MAPKQQKKRGRPSLYTPDIAASICARLAKGEPLTVICADEGMPADRTVREWQERDAEFSAAIAHARELGFDAIAWQAMQIADTPQEGEETTIKASGVETKRGDMLGHRKLQIETRLKLLAKWDPKRYGEKTQTALTDADGNPLAILLGQLGNAALPVADE